MCLYEEAASRQVSGQGTSTHRMLGFGGQPPAASYLTRCEPFHIIDSSKPEGVADDVEACFAIA